MRPNERGWRWKHGFVEALFLEVRPDQALKTAVSRQEPAARRRGTPKIASSLPGGCRHDGGGASSLSDAVTTPPYFLMPGVGQFFRLVVYRYRRPQQLSIPAAAR
jgi:hypothetical protein